MSYPLYGLCHKFDLISIEEGEDEAGGIKLGDEEIIAEGLKCRVTLMDGKDEREAYGEASGEHWKVISVYNALIEKQKFFRLSASSKAAPIPEGLYRIVWAKHQIDEFGRFHHTSMVLEREDENT